MMNNRRFSSLHASSTGVETNRKRRRTGLRALRGVSVEALEARSLLSTVLGQVIDDMNGNGLRDVGEPGLAGVTVTLERIDSVTGATTSPETTTTDSNGQYRFNGVTAGTYLVSEADDGGIRS